MMYRLFVILIFITFLSLPVWSFSQPWYYNAKGDGLECAAQRTPLFGTKWCKFTRIASELNAVCSYNCIAGYVLVGPKKNTCTTVKGGRVARFEPEQGYCRRVGSPKEPTIPKYNENPNFL